MWNCEHCGTQNIAASLDVCPGCGDTKSAPAESAEETSGSPIPEGDQESASSEPEEQDEPDAPAPKSSKPGW